MSRGLSCGPLRGFPGAILLATVFQFAVELVPIVDDAIG
jgi:hypothetical protein